MKSFLSLALIIFLTVIFSCRPDQKPPKQYFVPRDKLVGVLVDMHLLYGIQSTPEYRALATAYDSIDLYSVVFARHGITKAAFDSTIAYYSGRPEDLTSIYDEVIMQLTMMQDSLQKAKEY
jgi:hypothetical protein